MDKKGKQEVFKICFLYSLVIGAFTGTVWTLILAFWRNFPAWPVWIGIILLTLSAGTLQRILNKEGE